MEISKSLILNNSNITLEKIGNKLDYIEKDHSIGEIIVSSNGFGKPRPNSSIALGDNRQIIFLRKNDNHYLMAFGANRVIPSCVSVGKRENGIYYLIREIFDDIYCSEPLLLQRLLFLLRYNQVISRYTQYKGQSFTALNSISAKEKEYLSKIEEAIEIFGEYFLLLESDSNVNKKLRKIRDN